MDAIAYIESTYYVRLKRVSRDEFCGPCPWCGGDDRFRIWQDRGNYWCRPGPGHCGKSGWVDELSGEKLTQEQRRLLAIEAKQRELERCQQEQERRLSALERMARCKDHLNYHFNITNDAVLYWNQEGITNASIDAYKLGFCQRCPTDHDGRPSYTIPVFGRDGETLINIRHRLTEASNSGKYRPHLAGLGAQLFNAQFTNGQNPDRQRIIVTEGEKKSIVLSQQGISNVAIMGKRSFKREWLDWLKPFQEIYIALDPDATESAKRLTAMFNGRGRMMTLPVKADDFFSIYKGTLDDFKYFVKTARPVR